MRAQLVPVLHPPQKELSTLAPVERRRCAEGTKAKCQRSVCKHADERSGRIAAASATHKVARLTLSSISSATAAPGVRQRRAASAPHRVMRVGCRGVCDEQGERRIEVMVRKDGVDLRIITQKPEDRSRGRDLMLLLWASSTHLRQE
jgi:hypothetical protein